jgi:hypothetical protein
MWHFWKQRHEILIMSSLINYQASKQALITWSDGSQANELTGIYIYIYMMYPNIIIRP